MTGGLRLLRRHAGGSHDAHRRHGEQEYAGKLE
jgi:hypothetical protein